MAITGLQIPRRPNRLTHIQWIICKQHRLNKLHRSEEWKSFLSVRTHDWIHNKIDRVSKQIGTR